MIEYFKWFFEMKNINFKIQKSQICFEKFHIIGLKTNISIFTSIYFSESLWKHILLKQFLNQ